MKVLDRIHELKAELMVVAVCLVAFGCGKVELDGIMTEADGAGRMLLTLNAAKENVPGRTKSVGVDVNEGTDADYSVRDFLFFQFDENGNRLVAPQYFEYTQDSSSGQTVPVVLPKNEGIEYTAVVLANLHTSAAVSLFAKATTLEKLMQEYMSFHRETDAYTANPDAGYDLLMNGYKTFTSATARLDVTLYRNVAKFTVRIDNPSTSGITLRTAQIKSVPTKIDYFCHLIEDKCPEMLTTPYPKHSLFTTFDYDVESFSVAPGESKTLTYYLPAHLMGTSSASTESQKSVMAPDYATFIELYGVSADGTTFMRYRFYPGEDLVSDYNIKPNYHYTLPLKFTTMGDPASDARIEAVSAIIEEPEANSYIINPLLDDFQRLYNIPVANRVNTFWLNEANAGHIQNATGKTITAENEWSAEIIWQTSAEQLIEFYEFDQTTRQYTLTANDGRVSPVYKGGVALSVKPKKGARGNVLVGVFRTDASGAREYLWSWHLWITDYNPDECRNQNWDGRWKYILPSGKGEVHRYKGSAWDGDDAKYHNKWVMDRNLGAMSADGEDRYTIEGLFYQWGRKDPYHDNYNTVWPNTFSYDKSSDKFVKFYYKDINFGEYLTLPYLVNHPTEFTRGPGYFAYGDTYKKNLWADPDWNISAQGGTTKKSFFDPCPPGWKIPESELWDYFLDNSSYFVAHSLPVGIDDGFKYFFDWVDNGENYTIYPLGTGGGGFYGPSSMLCLATSSPAAPFLSGTIAAQKPMSRSITMTRNGMGIRPVQE